MTEIRVTTTAEIVDSRGRHLATVINTATARPGDNPRYFATFTRGAIQSTEHQINAALIAQFGDKPDAGPWPKAAGAVVRVTDLLSDPEPVTLTACPHCGNVGWHHGSCPTRPLGDRDRLPPPADCPACKAGTCSLHAGGPRSAPDAANTPDNPDGSCGGCDAPVDGVHERGCPVYLARLRGSKS